MVTIQIAFLWALVGKKPCANSVQVHLAVQKLCKPKSRFGICANFVQALRVVFSPAVASGLTVVRPACRKGENDGRRGDETRQRAAWRGRRGNYFTGADLAGLAFRLAFFGLGMPSKIS